VLTSESDLQEVVPELLAGKAKALLHTSFTTDSPVSFVSVPGRVNLIGEHIDYHQLPVLPMAIQRRVVLAFQARADRLVRAVSSAQNGESKFELSSLEPSPFGCWTNYLKAGAMAVQSRWKIARGLEAAVVSDLPVAAGLSSSTALLTGFAIALLEVNGISPSLDDLMALLPDGEQYGGTRGGGMDHAAVLASQPGCGLLVAFAPLELAAIPIPADWRFVIAHSLTAAEKSGAVREQYNRRRAAGSAALQSLGLESYRQALEARLDGARVSGTAERNAFRHTMSEARRVNAAVSALKAGNFAAFGRLLAASHASLRDQLQVSTPQVDALVEAVVEAGAAGARLTGAGFGGCVLALCKDETVEAVCDELTRRFYAERCRETSLDDILFVAEPSAGALSKQASGEDFR